MGDRPDPIFRENETCHSGKFGMVSNYMSGETYFLHITSVCEASQIFLNQRPASTGGWDGWAAPTNTQTQDHMLKTAVVMWEKMCSTKHNIEQSLVGWEHNFVVVAVASADTTQCHVTVF